MSEGTLQAVVAQQPWRQRVGYPDRVTDADWTPKGQEECPGGNIVRDVVNPKYWHCRDCGYIGWGTTTRHRPVLDPAVFLEHCRRFHLQKCLARGMSPEDALDQMNHVMAVALRCAAAKEPDSLREFLEGMVRL